MKFHTPTAVSAEPENALGNTLGLPGNLSPSTTSTPLSPAYEPMARNVGDVEDEPWFALGRPAATTGMRRGELLGLCWRDVDLDRERLNVRRQLQGSGRPMRFAPPKTEAGRRYIALDPISVEALRQHKDRRSVTCSTGDAQRLGMPTWSSVVPTGSDGTPTWFPMNSPACCSSQACRRPLSHRFQI